MGRNSKFTYFQIGGGEDYDRLRPLSYPNTSCFLVFYSSMNPNSYVNVTEKWIPEITHHCPEIPFVLIATKIDLLEDKEWIEKLKSKGQKPLTHQDGLDLAKKIKAYAFIETSAKTRQGVEEAIFKAVESTQRKIQYKKETNNNCILQ